MIRDPLFRQIVERLEDGHLDPTVFQDCAGDLLSKIYPTLAPLPGGSDAGMDGTIADDNGGAFLVATTSDDVIGNLTTNLRSHLKMRRSRRKVVVGTSQHLNEPRKNKLYERAAELGFVLLNVHDQMWMALRLLREPKWCKELLGLTGDPPALSVVPLTSRPLLTNALIAREKDLDWLRKQNGDKVLVGQPGSGKTFLLLKLVLDGWGLFVASKDRGKIADGIRSQQPDVLIVDDAHDKHELLSDLRHMREELGAEFSIVATCWPGDKETIAQILNLTDQRVRYLDLLNRDQMVEVIKGAGIHGPTQLIREIVNQAAGRPGLAVTLAHLCLQGGVKQVVLGDALSGSLLPFFEVMVGKQANVVLAAFSIGGDAGMSMNGVAHALGLNQAEIWEIVNTLAAGGALSETHRERLSVHPTVLRYALVRDVFFHGATSLLSEPLLEHAPDLGNVALTLIGAQFRGAILPPGLLLRTLEKARSEAAWAEYAGLGKDETHYVLRNHPDLLIAVAQPALYHTPQTVIPMLLTAAIHDQRPLNPYPTHPLRIIEDWIKSAERRTGQGLDRRKDLLKATVDWISSKDGEVETAIHALSLAFCPRFEQQSSDPGIGRTFTISWGLLALGELKCIPELWPKAVEALHELEVSNWPPLLNMIEDWAYPGRHTHDKIPREYRESMYEFAVQMVLDVCELAKGHPRVLQRLELIASHLDIDLDSQLDSEFVVLFPPTDWTGDWEAQHKSQTEAVQELASSWATLDPEQVTKRVSQFEREAQLASSPGPRLTPLLCHYLAEGTSMPGIWAKAMIHAGCASDLIAPFLGKAASVNEPNWKDLVLSCLTNGLQKAAGILVTLTHPDPPQDLFFKVLAQLEGQSELIRQLCMNRKGSENTIRALLEHDDISIASAAAMGEWYAEPRGVIREALRDSWRRVVLRWNDDNYWLSEIFKKDPTLAGNWVENQLRRDPGNLWRCSEAVKVAVSVIDINARRRILKSIPETFGVDEVVTELIGQELDLYRELLADKKRRRLHLLPLQDNPDEVWVQKALLALDAGYEPADIANAVYSSDLSWSGEESEMWDQWIRRFEPLCTHQDERIRQVGVEGRSKAERRKEQALRGERQEEIYG